MQNKQHMIFQYLLVPETGMYWGNAADVTGCLENGNRRKFVYNAN